MTLLILAQILVFLLLLQPIAAAGEERKAETESGTPDRPILDRHRELNGSPWGVEGQTPHCTTNGSLGFRR